MAAQISSVRHPHHLVHRVPAQPERQRPHLAHRHAVGEGAGVLQPHRPARLQGAGQAVGIGRLHPDHPDPRLQPLEAGGHARDQPAPAHRDEHRVQPPRPLAQQFHGHGALARDHVGVVVGRDHGEPFGLGHLPRIGGGVVEGVAVEAHLPAQPAHRLHLDGGRGHRHDDHRPAAQLAGRQGHPLGVVPGRGRHHAPGQGGRVQPGHHGVGAAQLEGEHRLQVLALEPDPAAQGRRQEPRLLQGRGDRHVVDRGGEDALEDFLGLRFGVAGHGTLQKEKAPRPMGGGAGGLLTRFLAGPRAGGGNQDGSGEGAQHDARLSRTRQGAVKAPFEIRIRL